MPQAHVAGSFWVAIAYGLRASLAIDTALTVGSGSMMGYYALRSLQASVGSEAVWLKGEAVLWLLWTCLWALYLAVTVYTWRMASTEQRRGPAVTSVPLTRKRLLWQCLQGLAVWATVWSYQVSQGQGKPVHEMALLAQPLGYLALLLSLAWTVALLLQHRHPKADNG